MNFFNFASGTIAALLLVSPALAQQGSGLETPEMFERGEAYRNARIALEINYLCSAYKGVEHWAVGRIAGLALGETRWYEATADMDEYTAFVDRQDEIAAARAAELGCTPAAEPIAFGLLEQAMGLLYGDLTLAFHFASLPPSDPDHLALGQDQMAAAQQYDMYLQHRFGPNFQAFAQIHRDRVGRELELAMTTEEFNPFGSYMDDYFMFDSAFADPFGMGLNWELMALRSDGQMAIDRVLLEVRVETAGLRMFERKGDTRSHAELVDATTGAVQLKIFEGPKSAFYNDEFDASYLLALTGTGAVRFVVWSEEAVRQLGDTPTVSMLFNSQPTPKGIESDYEFYQMPDWAAASEQIRAQKIEECFGTACYEFAADDIARMLETSSTELVELVISPRPDAGSTEPTASGYRPGQQYIGAMRQLHADWISGG